MLRCCETANEISVNNLAEGALSRPPFFMLDYAELTYNTQ